MCCAPPSPVSIHRFSMCSLRALLFTKGRYSITIRCPANVTLLGDACHPMTPYMAQGAAMAIEDAAVLSRCLEGVERDGVANAFFRFEESCKHRKRRVQQS